MWWWWWWGRIERGAASLAGKAKVGGAESILARCWDQGVVHGDDSSPCAAHSIHSPDYTAPLGNRRYECALLFSLKCEMQKKKKKNVLNENFPPHFVEPRGLKPLLRVHPKIAARLAESAAQRTPRIPPALLREGPSRQDLLITCSAGWKCRV